MLEGPIAFPIAFRQRIRPAAQVRTFYMPRD